MDSAGIINQLANNKKLKAISTNIAGSLGEDLWQNLFLILCQMKKSKIISIHKNKSIEFYCINIMSNEYHNKNSLFSKQYRHQVYDSSIESVNLTIDEEKENENINELKSIDTRENPIYKFFAEKVTQENFYKVELLRRWAEGESYRDISRKTNIPMRSIAASIQKTIIELRVQCLK